MCPRCSRPLGWRACRALSKCDKCDALLLTAKGSFVPDHLRAAAQIGAGLVSPIPATRQIALSSLSDPFRTWAAADALVGLCTLGEAKLWLNGGCVLSQAKGSAACIAEGLEFARQWPDSLARFVKASTDRSNSTSLQDGLGPLGRVFQSTSKNTPIRDLIRAHISDSFGTAIVPTNIYPGAIIKKDCRAGMLTALEAVETLGIRAERLRRLEGRSQTFLTRRHVKGGVALYDEAAISMLATVLKASVRHGDAARLLGIPRYCVDALVAANLVLPVTDQDANIVTEAPLIVEASITTLRDGLRKRSRTINEGITLRKAMQGVGDPHDWVEILQKLLAGHIQLQFDTAERLSLTDAVIVGPSDLASQMSRRFDGPGIDGIYICCQTAAEIIGTTQQFVAAAVKAGFMDGKVGLRNSAIPLHSALKIRNQFMLAPELCKKFGAHRNSITAELRKAGFSPAATINRINVWWRSDIQWFITDKNVSRSPDNAQV